MKPTQIDAYALELRGIDKRFPGVHALRKVSFACRAGEIHVLVGENGAGKSTLMRVAAGVWRAEQGEILVGGTKVEISGPHQAQELGIAMVYQDTRLVPELDVAQNIWLGREPGRLGIVDRVAMERRAAEILARLGASLPMDALVRDLDVAQRQLVEIARALTTDPGVLILDEPTSTLDSAEIERLFAIMRQLKAAGTAVIFISHRLPEVFAIADRITVLKDGEVVDTVTPDDVSHEDLVAMMVGRQMELAYPPRTTQPGAERLAVSGLSSPGAFDEVSFAARAGEIVGLGGIQGNGQAAVVRAIFGLAPTTGQVSLDGAPCKLGSPALAIGAGIVYVPGDRQSEGLFMPHSIRENVTLPHLVSWSGLGFLSARQERQATERAILDFAIKTPTGESSVHTLSGGNQQKVVLGRWTQGAPRVFMFEEPTRGVDVATKLEIYRRIRAIAEEGAAVILVTSDLLELIGLSDRILVFSRGRVVYEVAGEDATEETIVGSAVGAGILAGGSPGAKAGPSVGAPTAASGAAQEAEAAQGRQPGTALQVLRRRYPGPLLLAGLIVLLCLGTSSISPFFLTSRNLSNVATQVSPLALTALGQFVVILLGGIDLSVGPLISLVTAITSYVAIANGGLPVLVAVAAALGVGLVTGLVNALLIVRLRIPDLIATLATYSMVLGAALIVRPSPGGLVSDSFLNLFSAVIGPVPIAAVIVVLLFAVSEFLLLRGRVGLRLYSVGSSDRAAYVVGIPVGLVRVGSYLFCSLCAAAAGLLVTAQIGSGDPQAGASFTLTSVTAVVVGGASIFGGIGTAVGVLFGAIAVGIMQNALNLMHVSAYYQYVWAGGLTLIAVAAYSRRFTKGG